MSELVFRSAGIPEGGTCAQTDPEVFFPSKGRPNKLAKFICKEVCAVQDECLEGAIERREEFGIWGGLSQAERKRLLKSEEVAIS